MGRAPERGFLLAPRGASGKGRKSERNSGAGGLAARLGGLVVALEGGEALFFFGGQLGGGLGGAA
ncbi:MAG: hypothetical protein ABSA66_07840, partial [Roseiarcus sp.]